MVQQMTALPYSFKSDMNTAVAVPFVPVPLTMPRSDPCWVAWLTDVVRNGRWHVPLFGWRRLSQMQEWTVLKCRFINGVLAWHVIGRLLNGCSSSSSRCDWYLSHCSAVCCMSVLGQCVSWQPSRILLEQSFAAHMLLLMATSSFRLRRRH